MTEKRTAFLVLGGESTGTRLVTRLLISSGCYGDGGDEQRLDDEDLKIESQNLVWRRSFPHFGGSRRTWPNVPAMAWRFLDLGFSVHGLVTTRDWVAAAASQVAAGHVPTPEMAQKNLQRSYMWIFSGLIGMQLPFTIVSYESLTTNPAAIANFIRSLGLTPPADHEPIVDGNRKWFD